MQHLVLDAVSELELCAFLQKRAHGIPPCVTLGPEAFPAFRPGEADGVKARIDVSSEFDPLLHVEDEYGHGTYAVYDIYCVTRVEIITHNGSILSAARGESTDLFVVRIQIQNSDSHLKSQWKGKWQEGCLPA